MKRILYLFLITTFITGCDDDKPFSGEDRLPAETQTGANTVGCLVNGKVLLPHAEGISAPVNCYYQFVDGDFYFSLAFSDLRGFYNETVNIFTAKIELSTGSTYILNMPDVPESGGGGEYRLSSSNQYNTNSSKVGELKITRIDLQNSIISGTFWFDAVNSSGEIVEIRNGRFDWNY